MHLPTEIGFMILDKVTKAAGLSELSDTDAQIYAARIASDILVSKLTLDFLGNSDLPLRALGLMSEPEKDFLRMRVSGHRAAN